MDRNNFPAKTKKKANSLLWLYEPFEGDVHFVCQKFFFFDVAYLGGNLYLALVDREEPWAGLMVCTSREHHDSLQAEFPQLASHPVIGKWLYISRTHVDFESVASELVNLARRRDKRLGVEPGTRKRSAAKASARRLPR